MDHQLQNCFPEMNCLALKFFFISLVSSCCAPVAQNKLTHVISISTHGQRSPLGPGFESNPYADESFWPDGYSQLTIEGKQQMYWLGQSVGQMYSASLYTGDPRNVKAYALDIDRCIESAQIFATGLNPPNGRWIWNSQRLQWWQPHRIHQISDANGNCSFILTSEAWEKLESKHSKQMKKLSIHTGRKVTVKDMSPLYDSLMSIKTSGKILPNWSSSETLKYLQEVYTQKERLLVASETCVRERSGFLFKIISETLKNLVNTRNSFTTLNVRRFNLMAFLGGLSNMSKLSELNELNIPSYGATVLIEIYDKPWEVKINYVQQAASFNPEPVFISSCGDTSCPLDQFVSICNQFLS